MAMAALPLAWQDDALYLIYHLNRIISFTGASLLSTLKAHYSAKNVSIPAEIKQALGVIYAIKLKVFFKEFYTLSGMYDRSCVTAVMIHHM